MDTPAVSQPEFWDARYRAGPTAWDLGRIPRDLGEFLRRVPKTRAPSGPLRVLVPGCGAGHEVPAFLAAGCDVTALDFAPAAAARVRALVGPAHADRILTADFFTADLAAGSFDVIYERCFLAALAPERRGAYRDRMATLLRHGGSLVGCFYYQRTDPADGPPYGLAWGEADELFSRYFLLTKDTAVTDSLPLLAGRERWQERRRTSIPLAPA